MKTIKLNHKPKKDVHNGLIAVYDKSMNDNVEPIMFSDIEKGVVEYEHPPLEKGQKIIGIYVSIDA